MRKIIYTRPNGGVCVVHPVRNTHGEQAEFTDTDAEQRAWDKLPPDAINPRFADPSEVPADRTFRNAWKDSGSGIEHDIDKCRELTKERLRREREPKLAALDVEFMRAIEEGKPTVDIVAQKQILRDITSQVDDISDLEFLKMLRA